MKFKHSPLVLGFVLLLVILLIWWFSNHHSNNDEAVEKTTETKTAEQPTTSTEKAISEEPTVAVPTYVDSTDKQKEFSQRIQNLITATTNCQKDIEALFPVDSLEGPSKTYKTFNKFRDALEKFYKVVSIRVEKSNEFMNFLENLPDGEIPSERLFTQLSAIEDCGEFEEEAVLDQAMTTATEMKWPMEQKCELTNTIMNIFEQQLNTHLGLHQISAKIEVLHNLADEGFIPSKVTQELSALDQAMDNAEAEFRQSLPSDFAQKRVPSQKDIVDIKNSEREIIEKIKPQLQDFISSVKCQ